MDRAQEQDRIRQRQMQRMRRERQKKRKKLHRIYMLIQVCFICLVVVLSANILKRIRQMQGETETGVSIVADAISRQKEIVAGPEYAEKNSNIPQYAASCETDMIERPKQREHPEVLRKLEELGQTDKRIAKIADNAELYPENMLEALANNPEMADFVLGYTDRERAKTSKLTGEEKAMEHPLFLQWDPRWGYLFYGDDSNIGLAGCGPTSLAMALYYLLGDETLTPDIIADYAMENDYYLFGTGTKWALMEDVPGHYGVTSQTKEVNEREMTAALEAGKILICAMRPGDFTAAGHFIVLYGCEEDGFLVNDPNCVARSRQVWSYEKIESQIKQMWELGV